MYASSTEAQSRGLDSSSFRITVSRSGGGVQTASSPFEPVLVATKLHVPRLRPGVVPRRELVTRLVAGRDCKLTLVCAPAGWGKSTLISEWHAAPEETRPFAWLSLDPADHDPVRFWSYAIAALRSVRPGLGTAPAAALRSAGPDLVDVVVTPLINELAELPAPLVLVLDDYHMVRAESIHASLAFLLRHLPATLQLAIASRADPPLPVGALRAAGQVTEIRAADLRFGEAEAEELLNRSLGLGLDRADVDLLRRRTEGWAAGLQLAALSARTVENRHEFVSDFAGNDWFLGDYLRELLADQPASLRDFLLQTSILERLSAPLCDAVTGRDDCADQLDAVERSNLFLVSLDTRREWHRYHHLFRELLRHELMRTAPDLTSELHRRASGWHREHGNIDEAIAHATAAGDFDDAGELIACHWRPVWSRGQFETVVRWIDALPPDAVSADARLCLARGWAALYLDDAPQADRWRRLGEQAPLPAPFRDGTTSLQEGAAILAAAHANLGGDAGGAVEAARRALAHNREEDSPSRVVANVHLGLGAYYAGELATAEAAFEEALRSPLADEWASVRVAALGNLAGVQVEAGALDRAAETLAETEQAIERFHIHESGFACRSWIARGRLLEIQGDLAAAEAAFQRAVTLARRVGSRLVIAHGMLARALLARRRGAHSEARTLAREARRVLSACRDAGIVGELLARTERTLQLTTRVEKSTLAVDAELSERELVVLRLLASELSQREIGSELYISLNTVKGHTRSIFRKLGVSSRADAVARGRELTLL
jgi:LuxR family maltose regulon positive regulatory protein